MTLANGLVDTTTAALDVLLEFGKYAVDPVSVTLILGITVLCGWMSTYFWPPKLWPSYKGGAWLGLALSLAFSGIALYVCYISLRDGSIFCMAKHNSDCRTLSMRWQPTPFWATYLQWSLISIGVISWFFVCLRALRRLRTDPDLGS